MYILAFQKIIFCQKKGTTISTWKYNILKCHLIHQSNNNKIDFWIL